MCLHPGESDHRHYERIVGESFFAQTNEQVRWNDRRAESPKDEPMKHHPALRHYRAWNPHHR